MISLSTLATVAKRGVVATSLALSLSTALSPVFAAAPESRPGTALATDRGPADPAQVITVTVHLKLPDRAGFEAAVAARYDRTSSLFHHWMNDADLARFAPSAAQREAVRAQLEASGLSVVSEQRNGFSLRARGSIAAVSRAFNTEIHEFARGSQVFRANVRAASLGGEAGSYVETVAGLESHVVRPMLARAINARTGKPFAPVALRSVTANGGLSSMITDVVLSKSASFTYTTPNESLPTATYSGLQYDKNSALTVSFTSKQLQKAYGLTSAYSQGLDGTGQTIVLLEGYGYPTVLQDANAFAKLNGISPLTSANFSVVFPDGMPADPNAGILTGWDGEIALDVQWAHSIAPGATILVVASNGQDSEDFQAAMQAIIDGNLGSAVSDSWEEDTDLFSGPAEQQSFETVLQMAAAKGISFHFSTGDSGDGGLGTPLGAAGVPSVAPHATAIGGTALVNDVRGSGFQSVGWGDALALLDSEEPLDPPFAFFEFGGGGGESVYWPKPSWQSALPGNGRQTPDISALADPFTGVPIVVTEDGTQYVEAGVGGTSLASPIFTAIWAIAQQKAGGALGQAAPIIAGLSSGLTDVLPLTASPKLAGSVTDSSGTTKYTAQALFAGLIPGKQAFVSALWNLPQYEEALGFGFALDSSLTVTKGWDNATGYGTPQNGLAFIDAVAAASAPAE